MSDSEQETQTKPQKLSLMQSKFVEAYLGVARGIAAEACRVAGYKGANNNVLAATGSRLLTKVKIQEEIARQKAIIAEAEGIDVAWCLREAMKRYQACIQKREDGRSAIDEPSARAYLDQIHRMTGAYEADNRQRQTQLGMVIM